MIRKSQATLEVLTLMCRADAPVWGLQLVRDSGRPAGSVYPILARLEQSGWVESEWEESQDHGGPKRRYYRFTHDGAAAAPMLVLEAERAAQSRQRPVAATSRVAVA